MAVLTRDDEPPTPKFVTLNEGCTSDFWIAAFCVACGTILATPIVVGVLVYYGVL